MNNAAVLFPETPDNIMGMGSTVIHSSFDIIAGTMIARTSEALFNNAWTDLYLQSGNSEDNGNKVLFKKVIRVFLQVAFNAMASYEIRSLYESDKVDPLGGLFFVGAVIQQPKLWQRMKELSDEVYQHIVVEANYAGKTKQ